MDCKKWSEVFSFCMFWLFVAHRMSFDSILNFADLVSARRTTHSTPTLDTSTTHHEIDLDSKCDTAPISRVNASGCIAADGWSEIHTSRQYYLIRTTTKMSKHGPVRAQHEDLMFGLWMWTNAIRSACAWISWFCGAQHTNLSKVKPVSFSVIWSWTTTTTARLHAVLRAWIIVSVNE